MSKKKTENKSELLEQVTKLHQQQTQESEYSSGFTSNVKPAATNKRLESMILPMSERGRLPLTKEKYLIKENTQMVHWEREVRIFVKRAGAANGHRVSAVMIFEWATGLSTKQLHAEGKSASQDLKWINKALRHYFGAPYKTFIASRPVTRAYRVPKGYRINHHPPMTLTLWAEYREGTLRA